METPRRFRYRPSCAGEGCERAAAYKSGSAWSDGVGHEIKNYGLACEEHGQELLGRARARRAGLKLDLGEAVGELRLFRLAPDRRDLELECIDAPADAGRPARS